MTTARRILGYIRDGHTQAQAAVLSDVSPSWASRLLNDVGTTYKAARDHFRQGGTVDDLLDGPPPAFPEGADMEQLRRIEAKIDLLLQRFGVRP